MKSPKSKFSVAFREQSRPLLAYWALLLFSYCIFAVAVFVTEGRITSEDILILFGIYASCSIGCVLGQIAALYRFREIVGFVHGTVTFFCGAIILPLGFPEWISVSVGLYMLFGNIMFFAGMWSLQAGRAMFATWAPLLFSIGSVVVVVNHDAEKLATWKSGSKWMIWNFSSLTGFVVSMVLLIAYLVIRENLRIFRWRNGPRTTIASEDILAEEDKARISAKGWTSLIFMSVVLSLGVAFLSPYLWQTEIREPEEESEYEPERDSRPYTEEPPEDCDNYSGCAPPPHCRDSKSRERKPPPEAGSEEQMEQVVEQVGNFLWILLWMLVLMLLAYMVFGAPMRRLFYVRHYRDPLWPISTTKKIENQWDLIRIALADIGVEGSRGESAMNLVEQAIPKVQEVTGNSRRIPGLIAAAQIRDRVVFGLGVGVEDAQKMNENANWVYDSLWNRLGNWRQIKALYRRKLW